MSDHQNDNQDQNTDKKEVDAHSGVETTGHEWDGIKELNNPLPRWWLWVFYVCILWSVWYWVVYPAWPVAGGHTKGTGGYTQFKELEDSQNEIVARQKVYLDRFEQASFQEILDDPELYAFAMAGGSAMFKDNCATCHGTGAQGFKGYPNLNDDDWLWGGALSDIHQTIQYGIREDNLDTRLSQMPAFGKEGMLKNTEIEAVVDYVFSLSSQAAGHGGDHDLAKGQTIFAEQCASCHGLDGKGDREFGAPNLTDKIWLYGGDRASVFETVYSARSGMMPAWKDRLDKNTIRQLTIYLHQLGGGEEEREDGQEETVERPVEDIPDATYSE
ncbi:MAG: cytochrome-c oxidase, cbb3-type subunit III [Alphaproteobacteria bacterium]|nr:MAG: cytochrome-c oxidase, cbb3-type subunit III [Alphaproteobacteria bacterium]